MLLGSIAPLHAGDAIGTMVAAIDAENRLGNALREGLPGEIFLAKLNLDSKRYDLSGFAEPVEIWQWFCQAFDDSVT